jgi:hypothetical protein
MQTAVTKRGQTVIPGGNRLLRTGRRDSLRPWTWAMRVMAAAAKTWNENISRFYGQNYV